MVDRVATSSYIGPMRAVGVRDLKNRLSEYLDLVRLGESVLVTDRGRVVAELRPPGQGAPEGVPPGLLELVRRGGARLGAPNAPELYPAMPRLAADGESLRWLTEDRGER